MENQLEKNNSGQKLDKEFKLTTLSLDNGVSVMFLTFIITIMGIVTYVTLPKESYPEIKQPVVYIGVPYYGNSPVDMENLITRPIEKELNSISEIDHIKSTAVQDYTNIIVEFNSSTDVEDALSKVKDAVDKAKTELPEDLDQEPNIFELDFSEFPVMNINLSGDYSMEQLKDYAEYLEDEIEKITEISKVEIRGVADKEVKINVDPYQMEARLINFDDIQNAIRSENITASSGNVLDNEIRRSIRIVGEFDQPSQLEDIVIKNENSNIVYLKDIATVEFDYKERDSYARLKGEPVVMLDVIKRGGENLLAATDKINIVLDKARENGVLPPDLNISITNDQSSMTREMVSSLFNNIISGVLVVVLILLLFIGTRNAMFVGMAIPLSMFMTFFVLGVIGMTVNMMVLFGLIMALGMLVDNGIVVVENIYRLRESGYSMMQAAKLGVGEVALPIISSTATTLAAFLPLAMWPGVEGEFMKILPITLMVALSSSLFVALVVNPVFIARYMKLDGERKVNKKRLLRDLAILGVVGILFLAGKVFWLGNLIIAYIGLTLINVYALVPLSARFQTSFLPWLESKYNNTIVYALKGRRPIILFASTIVLLIFSFVLMGIFPPKTLYFPENLPKYVNVFIEFPVGTDIEETNKFTKDMEQRVIKIVEPHTKIVESVISNVGEGTGDPNDMSTIGQSGTPNKARITVNFVDFKYRDGVSTLDVMEEIRDGVQGYPGVSVSVVKNADGPPAGKPISIEITGDDSEQLVALADKMKNLINSSDIMGIEKLNYDIETGKPELIVDLDREKARRYGLSTSLITSELRTSLFGAEVSKYKDGEDDYEIQVRLDDKYRYDVDALMNKSVTFRDQTNGKMHQVPISSVAKAELSTTYGNVKRKDLTRIITLGSNVLEGYTAAEVNKEIKDLLEEEMAMPAGYEYKFSGEQEKQEEQMAFLLQSLLLAIFVIFLIIVAQFNKISAPFIIISSVLFSTTGVFFGLIIFQMEFVIMMTMVGIISLAGIVVNNSIVLIDFIELQRKRVLQESGKVMLSLEDVRDAIIMAAKTRLRPVLLTAITTVLGLIPLAVGVNIDFIQMLANYNPDFYLGGDTVIFWGPLSWTIIFGLVFATFLTLVIVPVMYLLIERFLIWWRGFFAKPA